MYTAHSMDAFVRLTPPSYRNNLIASRRNSGGYSGLVFGTFRSSPEPWARKHAAACRALRLIRAAERHGLEPPCARQGLQSVYRDGQPVARGELDCENDGDDLALAGEHRPP